MRKQLFSLVHHVDINTSRSYAKNYRAAERLSSAVRRIPEGALHGFESCRTAHIRANSILENYRITHERPFVFQHAETYRRDAICPTKALIVRASVF